MPSFLEQNIDLINKLLTHRPVPSKEEYLSEENPHAEVIGKLYDEVLTVRETLKNFSQGNFNVQIAGRGIVTGYLKALQAHLRHLTWQVEQVAAGDLSQRVDFMGDFSTAFNKMVLQLEDSLEEMKNREAAERTQIMLDATPLCCCFWNEQHELLDCNLEAVKLHGTNSKKEYLDRFFEFAPTYQPDGRLSAEVIHQRLNEVFETGYSRCEFIHQTITGEPIPAEVTLVRVRQQEHYIVASYVRDLRELKKQQSAIEQQQLLLFDAFRSSPICFAILVDDEIKFSSIFMEHFLGLAINEPFIDCFVDQEKGKTLLSNVKNNLPVHWEPVTIRSKEGDVKEMLANLSLTNYYGEQGVIAWLVDITEIKKIEADLRVAKETAEHLGRVKDEFIANISHELRTPMNAVLGIIHLLRNTTLSDEQTLYLSTVEVSAKNLLQIINDILDFSAIESGKVFLLSDDFDVRQTLVNVCSYFRETAEAKKLLILHSVGDDVPALIAGDSVKLQRILMCLTDNAVKFTEQGSVRLRVQLESLEIENAVLRFSVHDTGIGINDADLACIFHPFSQADNSGTRKYGGAGLGLTVAKSLVEIMGGRIWCESEHQKGTTFFFTAVFKLSKDDGGIIFPESFQGMSILLAEDNKINQIVATKLLQARGFNVDIAPDGLQAVDMVKQKDYALVFMDIQMPKMDGIQATRTIRSDPRYKTLPIVALTANVMEDDLRQYREVGMNDYVAKPISPLLLDRAILQWANPADT